MVYLQSADVKCVKIMISFCFGSFEVNKPLWCDRNMFILRRSENLVLAFAFAVSE